VAKLASPQLLFGRVGGKSNNPDADLLLDSPEATPKGKGKTSQPGGHDPIERLIGLEIQPSAQPKKGGRRIRRPISDPNADSDTDLENEDDMFEPALPNAEFNAHLRMEAEAAEESQYEPLDVPQQEAGPSKSQPEEDDWEVPAWENSDEELDI
jgi:hypothetical protein